MKIKNLLLSPFRSNKKEIVSHLASNTGSIDPDAVIRESVLSGEISVGPFCKVFQSTIRGKVSIDKNTTLWGPGIQILSGVHPIRIGKFCSIASNVVFQEYNHNLNSASTYFVNQNIFGGNMADDINSSGSITIGNDVWIGAQSIILSGVTIGDGAVIGANSVVTSDVAPYSISAGSPAREIRPRFSEEIIQKLKALNWWDWDSEKIKRNHQFFNGPLSIEKFSLIVD